MTGGQDVTSTQAIPTAYHGIDMRSKLEAEWAATLDYYRIEWEYEPELIRLAASGEQYLPDFWLPRLGTLLEVKGAFVGRTHKPVQLAAELDLNEIVLFGFAPEHRSWSPQQQRWDSLMKWRDVAGFDTRFTQCAECSAWQWLRPQISAACRRCRVPSKGFLASPGEVRFNPGED